MRISDWSSDVCSSDLITQHWSIDTEAAWTPDSQHLMFTSARGGKPQIYEVSATGGDPVRLTFNGDYNARATISWDGKKVAMAQGSGNVYRISVMDRRFGDLGRWHTLSPGNLDERTTISPNKTGRVSS